MSEIKKILMRAPASPFLNPTAFEGITQNLISSNSGNLVFPSSVSRALMREGVEIEYTKANRKLTEEEADRINSTFDCFVIPLANMFRGDASGMSTMPILTDIVRKLKIPCMIVGVGVQLELDDEIDAPHRFDEPSRELVRAVLEKSPMIALRGEITGKYMEHLGFVPERDFTVTGCPSMYYYGPVLPQVKKLNLTPDSRVNLNCKITLPQKIHTYMNRVLDEIEDHWYIPQNTYELRFMFQYKQFAFRGPFKEVLVPEGYPASFEHRLYRENRVRGFVSLKAWMDFLSQGDLNFGTRIHGNIAAVLSGIPAFIVAPDSRVNELASFHHIAHTTIGGLDETKSIFDLLDGVDFEAVHRGHRERFAHYLDFLHACGLPTIYDGGLSPLTCPFDERLNAITFHGPVLPFPFLPEAEKEEALKAWSMEVDDRNGKILSLREERDQVKADRARLREDKLRLLDEKEHLGQIRKEKTEKILALREKNKNLKEENRALKKELADFKREYRFARALKHPVKTLKNAVSRFAGKKVQKG